MFYENGFLGLILGPMFSGKSTRLIQYIKKYKTLNIPMIVVKPSIDTRYTSDNVLCTHNLEQENCIVYQIDKLANIFDNPDYPTSKLIIIEEGQFFNNIYSIIKQMTDVDKKIVWVSALNGDSKRELFGEIYRMIPLADNIEFLQALCIQCRDGTPGIYSKRLIESEQQLIVGSTEYNAVCRKHYLEN
jgi:thymidine kinase